MKCGIYVITNLLNNKKYVGSSCNLTKRWSQHQYFLRKGNHGNPYFQLAWDKYGSDAFGFEVVEYCPKTDLLIREHWWIEHLQCFRRDIGYNMCRFPRASRLGCKASPETIKKMSLANGGKNHPNWGKKLSPSHVANIRRCQVGVSKPTSGARKEFSFVSPSGDKIVVKGLREFCRANSLSHSMMWRVARGKQKMYRGWTKYD